MLIVHVLPTASFGGWSRDRYKTKFGVVVFATDGLWDCLTNEEVVGLVGIWLRGQKSSSGVSSAEKTGNKVWERDELLVKLKDDKTVMYQWWRSKKRFIDVDSNVAVNLVRNALLGGADRDLTSALLHGAPSKPPRSRRYRCVP